MAHRKRAKATTRRAKARGVNDLTPQEARNALSWVVEAMYPEGDPDHGWSPDTLDTIARWLDHYGLVPKSG
jgi:hypothetical protein